MPKLNATIDDIELKSNKIISTDQIAPADWTDAQYPSAKTLLNIAHPVGSILATTVNEDPSADLGGAWELVDKSLATNYITLNSSHWVATSATIESSSNALVADHAIAFRINLRTTVELTDDNIELGKIDINALGLNELVYTVMYIPVISDLGNCTLSVKMQVDGTITTHDVLNVDGTHKMPAGTDFFINLVLPVSHNKMLAGFCDKFYWKRTA